MAVQSRIVLEPSAQGIVDATAVPRFYELEPPLRARVSTTCWGDLGAAANRRGVAKWEWLKHSSPRRGSGRRMPPPATPRPPDRSSVRRFGEYRAAPGSSGTLAGHHHLHATAARPAALRPWMGLASSATPGARAAARGGTARGHSGGGGNSRPAVPRELAPPAVGARGAALCPFRACPACAPALCSCFIVDLLEFQLAEPTTPAPFVGLAILGPWRFESREGAGLWLGNLEHRVRSSIIDRGRASRSRGAYRVFEQGLLLLCPHRARAVVGGGSFVRDGPPPTKAMCPPSTSRFRATMAVA
jgi:hypothetical protein